MFLFLSIFFSLIEDEDEGNARPGHQVGLDQVGREEKMMVACDNDELAI